MNVNMQFVQRVIKIFSKLLIIAAALQFAFALFHVIMIPTTLIKGDTVVSQFYASHMSFIPAEELANLPSGNRAVYAYQALVEQPSFKMAMVKFYLLYAIRHGLFAAVLYALYRLVREVLVARPFSKQMSKYFNYLVIAYIAERISIYILADYMHNFAFHTGFTYLKISHFALSLESLSPIAIFIVLASTLYYGALLQEEVDLTV